METKEVAPSFCPIRHGQPRTKCKREETCRECEEENTDYSGVL
jgi:hypothetical protein